MSRRCPECKEAGNRPHLVGCSFAPPVEEREAFIREHAVELVRQLEEQVRRQAKELAKQHYGIHRLKKLNEQLAERVAAQSELLSRRAEKTP